MHREEAIKKVKAYLTDYLPIEDGIDEINEIISALQTDPCKSAVSRQSVKEHFVQWFSNLLENHTADESFEEIIDNLPSVQTKVGHRTMLTKEEFESEFTRMMDSVRCEYTGEFSCRGVSCYLCPVMHKCRSAINSYDIIEAVEKWSNAHPITTMPPRKERT